MSVHERNRQVRRNKTVRWFGMLKQWVGRWGGGGGRGVDRRHRYVHRLRWARRNASNATPEGPPANQ